MALIRGGVPFVHMYSSFRDNGANSRGCWWCADKSLWLGGKYGVSNTISLEDGIHLNHPNGYIRWASVVTPFMEQYKMNTPNRTDNVMQPGAEVTQSNGCDDTCLILICYFFGVCK